MKVKKLFDGIFKLDDKLATANLVIGSRAYSEDLVSSGGTEYRLWNPYRSKLAAAIICGLKHMEIKKGSAVLYLGAATGTTPSHISDIVGINGSVFCIEISERSMRDLLKVCEKRHNMLPILQDARNIDGYSDDVGTVDVIYQDVSARDQDAILLLNSKLLKPHGYAYVAIKSQSIDVSKDPEKVFETFLRNISPAFSVIEKIYIEPFDKMHLFVVLKKI